MKRVIFKGAGPISIIYYRYGKRWVAHALQFDLMGMGSSKENALNELQGVFHHYVMGHIKKEQFDTFLNPADKVYWNMEKYPPEHFMVVLSIVVAKATKEFIANPVLSTVKINRIAPYLKEVSFASSPC